MSGSRPNRAVRPLDLANSATALFPASCKPTPTRSRTTRQSCCNRQVFHNCDVARGRYSPQGLTSSYSLDQGVGSCGHARRVICRTHRRGGVGQSGPGPGPNAVAAESRDGPASRRADESSGADPLLGPELPAVLAAGEGSILALGDGPRARGQFRDGQAERRRSAGTARLYGVSSIPTDVIITPNGRLVSQLQSPPSANQYVAQMNQAATGHRELAAPPQMAQASPPVPPPGPRPPIPRPAAAIRAPRTPRRQRQPARQRSLRRILCQSVGRCGAAPRKRAGQINRRRLAAADYAPPQYRPAHAAAGTAAPCNRRPPARLDCRRGSRDAHASYRPPQPGAPTACRPAVRRWGSTAIVR